VIKDPAKAQKPDPIEKRLDHATRLQLRA